MDLYLVKDVDIVHFALGDAYENRECCPADRSVHFDRNTCGGENGSRGTNSGISQSSSSRARRGSASGRYPWTPYQVDRSSRLRI